LTDRNGTSARYPTFFNGETISGTVDIKLNSNTLKHKGIKAEIHGIVEKYGTLTSTNSFLMLTQDLIPAGEIIQEKTTLDFNFRSPYLKYESYKGAYASVKYFIKIIIDSTLVNSTYDKEFAVVNPYDESIIYENDFPIRLRVGVKNVISLSIEFEHCNYNCRGTLKGFITFKMVNANIKCMEVQLVRREVIFDGKKYEPEYIARYELIDGGPIKHDRIPFRFFLKSYNLTPSYPDIEGIFGVKYFLNLQVVDEGNNRYYKLAEINLFRIFRDRRAHMENFDNNGLFISEPIFEEDYYYHPNTMENNNNNNYNDNNYGNDYYNDN
jgi:vacuolar protein sorting-associated protein 26